jgi:hypothetical protein
MVENPCTRGWMRTKVVISMLSYRLISMHHPQATKLIDQLSAKIVVKFIAHIVKSVAPSIRVNDIAQELSELGRQGYPNTISLARTSFIKFNPAVLLVNGKLTPKKILFTDFTHR